MQYYLGIDGGGTSTRMRLQNDAGVTLGQSKSGSANIGLGADIVLSSMQSCISDILGQAQLTPSDTANIHVAGGLAGTETIADVQWLHDYFQSYASFAVYSDCHVACVGAFSNDHVEDNHVGDDRGNDTNGALLISGTGSVGWAINGDKSYRVGGWGFYIGDLYSGAWLGHEALRRAAYYYDGLCDSAMSKAVLEQFDGEIRTLFDWSLKAKPADYAQFAPYVINHAENGDATAIELMQQAGDGIGEMANHLLTKSNTHQWCFVGGVSHAITPYLQPPMAEKLITPRGDALTGAIMLARKNSKAL